MAKFSIAPKPTFTIDVAIPQVGDKPAMVPFTFKYRDRTALAELFDTWKAKAEAIGERFKGAEPTLTEITAAEVEQGVDQIKDLVVSWGFGEKLNDESITALVKSCIGVSDAVVRAYSEAFGKARLGN
ncbi:MULTISPECIES: phage tail assembly chaperone [unclassified Pseudomonas]|uniref:phage tail assembly chaperone n=1 Tax=unclassified Pseudomonas TaxID=196821 RepID=UPI00119D5837|nr:MULTISPECIES: phage tail assembly chaperone [unclassified Pseudomonas]TWC27715.1 tail assembly chaperone [Pseudomonas sp. SJZ083]TWC53945.1 tail assembly chaperone [Pseudomonas sp. SJZ077]